MDGISIRDLSVSYNLGIEKLEVIKNLNLKLSSHKISVILGKSGCGKTTLLRTLDGLEKSYSGNIDKGDFVISYVFQEPRLMPWLNVYENIVFGLKEKKDVEDNIDKLLSEIDLLKFKYVYPRQISGGMKSRVALARALAIKPDFLLMDEPFASLDYFTRENMQTLLLELYRKNDLGILFVTHSIDEAIKIGNEILIMDEGNIKKKYKVNNDDNKISDDEIFNLRRNILTELKE